MGTTIKIGVFLTLINIVNVAHAEEPAMPDAESLDRLLRGEVTVETIREDESGGAARFEIYMAAPVEKIWDVIFSCENAFVFLDGLKICEVIEDDGIHTLTRQVVKTSWLLPKQDYTFRTLREPYRRADFERVEGSPKVMEGSWQFVPLQDGVLTIHEIRIRPDVPTPRFIIRRLMKKSMPEMLACMRSMAGGSLNEEQAREDRRSCPGENRDRQGR